MGGIEGILNLGNWYLKMCSTLIITREMKLKSIVRYHLTPVIKKTIGAGEDVRKKNSYALLLGIYIGVVTMKNSTEVP